MPDPAPLDPMLLSILVCPADRGPLLPVDDVLYNPRLRKAYRIEDGIPVLLVDEAVAAVLVRKPGAMLLA